MRPAADILAFLLLLTWGSEIAGTSGLSWLLAALLFSLSPTAFLLFRYGLGWGRQKWGHWFGTVGIAWLSPLSIVAILMRN